jgi:hypothetical protein
MNTPFERNAFFLNDRSMNFEWFAKVRQSAGRVLSITRSDGEIVVGKLLGIDQDYGEVFCELVSSSEPGKYPSPNGVRVAIPFGDIQAVTDCCGRGALSRRRPTARWHGSRRRTT